MKMLLNVSWDKILISAGVGSTAVVAVILNVILVVMVVVRCFNSRDDKKNVIQSFVWLSLVVSEILNASQYIAGATVYVCDWRFLQMSTFLRDLRFIQFVYPTTAIAYTLGLIALNFELILRPYLQTLQGVVRVAVGAGCGLAAWIVAEVLVSIQYEKGMFDFYSTMFSTWLSVLYCVLNICAVVLSCHLTCSPGMRGRFAAAILASARIQQPGESGSESLASQGVNQDFLRNYGSINSGSSNVEIEEQTSGTVLPRPGIHHSRLLLENSITSAEATSSTLPHREDALSGIEGCVGLPRNVVGSNPIDHVEPQNLPPPHQVMMSSQAETEAEETTSPQTPLLPQTDLACSALGVTNPCVGVTSGYHPGPQNNSLLYHITVNPSEHTTYIDHPRTPLFLQTAVNTENPQTPLLPQTIVNTDNPQTPLLPQTIVNTDNPQTQHLPPSTVTSSALDNNPRTEAIKICILTVTSTILMFPSQILGWLYNYDIWSKDAYVPCFAVILEVSCLRSVVLAILWISFIPSSIGFISGRFEYKIMF